MTEFSFRNAVLAAIRFKDGPRLKDILHVEVSQPELQAPLAATLRRTFFPELSKDDDPNEGAFSFFTKVVYAFRDTVFALTAEAVNYRDVFVQHNIMMKAFAPLLGDEGTGWYVEALYDAIRTSRKLAILGDRGTTEGTCIGAAAGALTDVARVLRQSTAASLKAMIPHVVNEQLRLCVISRSTEMTNGIVMTGGGAESPDYQVNEFVTYKYFMGSHALLVGATDRADGALWEAFHRCPAGANRAKRQILRRLVATAIVERDKVPTQEMLAKYGLQNEYGALVRSVKSGNIALYEAEMERNASIYARWGVYIVLEKARMLVFRNVVRRVTRANNNSTQMKLGTILAAIDIIAGGHVDVDLAELQCMLANLIFENRMRGYIHYQHNTLSVSAREPFPRPQK